MEINKVRLTLWKSEKESHDCDCQIVETSDEFIIYLSDSFVKKHNLGNKKIGITEVSFEDE